jgi:uncharacterized protein (TIGR03083 family)
MQLAPLYLDRPLISLDGDPSAIAAPAIAQRQRLAAAVADLSDEELRRPSRCDGWSGVDVLSHLDGTNRFWSMSIGAAVAGEPGRVLQGFDPVATPAAMVDAGRDRQPREVVEAVVASTDELVADIAAIDADAWTLLGEAPPGHLTLSAVVHHALWDSWVHERDILLPLGVEPVEEADEVAAGLRYAATLGPAIGRTMGDERRGRMVVIGHEPAVAFTVDVAELVTVTTLAEPIDAADATGPSVSLLEAFSARAPFPEAPDDGCAWMLRGLAVAFDQA